MCGHRPGWVWRRALVGALGGLWAFRLAAYILVDRVMRPEEDGRYRRMREYWGDRAQPCRQGLWRYSRHPNYFCEWLHWWSYVLIGVGLPGWLRPDGRLFVHVFCHRERPYFFDVEGAEDWMARFFFTGGIMPADDLLPLCATGFDLEERWAVNGRHYGRTLREWLVRLDAQREAARPILAATYGAEHATLWRCRWRLFLMACEELFNCRGGTEWYVAHYRLAAAKGGRT